MGGITGYDKDGNPRELGSAEEAHKLYDKGEISFTKGQNLKMRSSDGRIFNVFAENYELARRSGASLVTDTEVREQGKADEIRDGGKAAAFARGAASTVVDPLLAVGANLAVTKDFRDISRDALANQRTDLEESERQFAGATMAGKVTGYVLPTLATAGANLGLRAGAQVTAKGFAAATAQRTTVAGISNVAGETAAQLAIKAATKLGAGKLATKVAGLGAQGAAEGAIQSAADAMVQATLDNPDHVAESMLMSGISGGAIGAAGNVLLMGTGSALWKGAKAGTSSIAGMAKRLTRGAAQELGEVNPAVIDAAERKVSAYVGASPAPSVAPDAPPIKTVPLPDAPAAAPAGAADGGIPGQPAAPSSGGPDPDSFAVKFTAKVTGATEKDVAASFNPMGADAIDNPIRFVEDGAEKMTKEMRDGIGLTEEIDDLTSTHGSQYKSLERLIPETVDVYKTFDFAVDNAGKMQSAIRDMIKNTDSTELGKLAGFKRLANRINDGEIDIAIENAASESNGAAQLAIVLDKFKTDVQHILSKRPGRGASPELRRAWEELRRASDIQQQELANASEFFGESAAEWYAKKNAAWTEQLSWKRKFGKEFLDIPEQDGWDLIQDIAPDKMTRHMQKAGEFEASNQARALKEALSGRINRMEAVAQEEAFGPDLRKKAAEAADKLRKSLDFYDDFAAKNRIRISADKVAAQAQQRASGIKFAGEVAGSFFGPIGMLVGGRLAEAASRPDRIANTLAAVRTMAGKRSGAILSAAGGVSSRARDVARPMGSAAARASASRALVDGAAWAERGVAKPMTAAQERAAVKAAASQAPDIMGGLGKASRAARPVGRALVGGALFLAYRDKVREITDATTRTAGVDPDELDAITPGLGQALEAKRAAALQYLKSNAPVGATGRGMFGHLEGPKPPEYQAREFMERVRAVEDPMSVLEDVKAGRFSAPAIEALRAVYPGTFAQVQQVVTEQLFDLRKPPPYESRIELFRLFGIAADPSLSPEFLASMQSLSPGPVPGQNPQKPKAGSSPSRLASMSVSQTERTLTR